MWECKEVIDKGVCDKGFIWNPINCECEYDKSCDIGKYLDYSNCEYMKLLVDKLTEECTKKIKETRLAEKPSAEMNINVVLVQCIRCYYGYFSYSL